jgi:hypothetical protein
MFFCFLFKKDDGCFALGDSDIEKFCETIGYGKVTTPSISGFQTMDDIRKAFGYLQYHLERVKHNFNETDQCYYPLLELICGIHASKCDSGKVVSPICREHCEGMILFFATLLLAFKYFLRCLKCCKRRTLNVSTEERNL